MAATGRLAGTGLIAHAGIDAEFQPFGMDVICEGFDTRGKMFGTGLNESKTVTDPMPAVINDDILIPCILHSGSYQGISHIPDHFFIHVAGKFIPAVPTHRRSESQVLKF